MYSKIFAKRIEDLCHRYGLTSEQLLDKCGPERASVHRIAAVFQMTLAEFLDFPELNGYDPGDEDEESP